MNQKISTKRIVLAALLAALTVAGSAIRIKVPVSLTGVSAFHLGNILCALSGILLGPWLGGMAAGMGSAIYDMLDPYYISECWLTFLMKGAYGLVAGLIAHCGKKWGYGKATAATTAGAGTYALLYLTKTFFYSGMLMKGLSAQAAAVTVVTKLPATTFNAVVAILFAPMLAVSIRKALKNNHLSLD
jgi:uncharacterized membrane protein